MYCFEKIIGWGRCTLQELTIAFGITAALLHGVAYILYNVQVRLGKSSPNAASWGVWAFIATLNALSYREMSGDVVASLQFFMGSIACVITFLYVLAIGKFSRLRAIEWALFALGLLATLVWWKFQSAAGANMILLAAFLFSFIPTLTGVLRNSLKETSWPWGIWALAYFITTLNLALRDGQLIAFITPIVLLISHGSIAVLALRRKRP